MKKFFLLSITLAIILTAACVRELSVSNDTLGGDDVPQEELIRLNRFEVDGLQGFINVFTGERVIEPQFAWVGFFSDGLVFVRGVEGSEYQTGYIDIAGNLIIPLPEISEGGSFSEGLAFVRGVEGREDLTGYIDLTGNLVIPLPSAIMFGDPFSEGLAFVRGEEGREDLTGYIDLTGNLVIPLPTVIAADQFSHGFASILHREWRPTEFGLLIGVPGPFIFIDRDGQNAFGREFQYANPFAYGLALVSLRNGNHAFIDTSGRNAFGREFRRASDFDSDGYARVTLRNGSERYIDRAGNLTENRP